MSRKFTRPNKASSPKKQKFAGEIGRNKAPDLDAIADAITKALTKPLSGNTKQVGLYSPPELTSTLVPKPKGPFPKGPDFKLSIGDIMILKNHLELPKSAKIGWPDGEYRCTARSPRGGLGGFVFKHPSTSTRYLIGDSELRSGRLFASWSYPPTLSWRKGTVERWWEPDEDSEDGNDEG